MIKFQLLKVAVPRTPWFLKYNVQTDEVPRDLSALNGDAGDSGPLRRDTSSPLH
jgi:hypothetical protein